MTVFNASIGVNCGFVQQNCPDLLGCPGNQCPDINLKRHDTKPPFRVEVDDCDGALDLTDSHLVLEVNMWAKAKLKTAITTTDTYFGFADDIGFEQVMVGDIIVMNRARLPEYMLVLAFDETNKLIEVQRGYHNTTISSWKKGTGLRIIKSLNASASIESVYEDVLQEDGTTKKNVLTQTFLVYDWSPKDTCLAGCYWLEFKLLKMVAVSLSPIALIPSFTPSNLNPEDFGCLLGDGVEWVRRFPSSDAEGFLVKINDSISREF